MCAPSCFRFSYVPPPVPSPKASLTAQFPVRSEAKLGLPDAAKSTAKNPERVFMAAAAYNQSISSNRIFIHFIWVWLLFGNELPPLHRLKEALLVLINMEGPVLLEMLREVNRSEEHTSELQSRGHLVCRLLLEKKKKKKEKIKK